MQKGCSNHGGSNSGLCVVQSLELGEPGSVSYLLLSRMHTRWQDIEGVNSGVVCLGFQEERQ